MNKRDFTRLYLKYSNKEEMTILEGVKEVDGILDMIGKMLKENGKIKFTNFCSMDVIERAERRIADPNTKEPMIIKPPKKIRFSIATKKLKEMN